VLFGGYMTDGTYVAIDLKIFFDLMLVFKMLAFNYNISVEKLIQT